MSWFGGLVGGVVAGLIVVWRKRLPLLAMLAAAAPAITLRQAVGRIGCFLVPFGQPVHKNSPQTIRMFEGARCFPTETANTPQRVVEIPVR